jgi:hypothetical protein
MPESLEPGYRVMVNPFSELTHYERQTRKTEQPTKDFLTSYKHYKTHLEFGYPYWKPNLSCSTPEITFRQRNEERALRFVQRTLDNLGYPVVPPPVYSHSPALAESAGEERQLEAGLCTGLQSAEAN